MGARYLLPCIFSEKGQGFHPSSGKRGDPCSRGGPQTCLALRTARTKEQYRLGCFSREIEAKSRRRSKLARWGSLSDGVFLAFSQSLLLHRKNSLSRREKGAFSIVATHSDDFRPRLFLEETVLAFLTFVNRCNNLAL